MNHMKLLEQTLETVAHGTAVAQRWHVFEHTILGILLSSSAKHLPEGPCFGSCQNSHLFFPAGQAAAGGGTPITHHQDVQPLQSKDQPQVGGSRMIVESETAQQSSMRTYGGETKKLNLMCFVYK